jgi:uncharacterized protein involved in exopolysaccharide biosynthesis
MRDYATLQESYTSLLTKSQESNMAAALERRQIGEQFRIIDPARLPERPISPNRPYLSLVGAAAGFGLGLALIALFEYRDTGVRTDDDVTFSLALPVLAVIPAMVTERDLGIVRQRWKMAAATSLVVVAMGVLAVAAWKLDFIERWVR